MKESLNNFKIFFLKNFGEVKVIIKLRRYIMDFIVFKNFCNTIQTVCFNRFLVILIRYTPEDTRFKVLYCLILFKFKKILLEKILIDNLKSKGGKTPFRQRKI